MDRSARGFISPVILAISVIAAVIVVFLANNNQVTPTQLGQSTSQLSTKNYQSAKYGLTLKYPEGWSMKENPAADIVVAFGSPKESSKDKFVDNINISIINLAPQPSLKTVKQAADQWIRQTTVSYPSLKLLTRKPSTMTGQTAEELIYTISSQGFNLKGMVVITIKNKMAYIMTYSAESASFDKFVDAANTVTTSLQVK
ncbi:DcrB-related protein [Candidatus Microgenomates bacterium]|nr:DcrB-related protein [Candidatus Microgenomates bacterium]